MSVTVGQETATYYDVVVVGGGAAGLSDALTLGRSRRSVLVVDGLTSVPGVWAAGNVADIAAQVVGAAEAGVRAGAAINADLIAEDTRRAVTAYRARREASTAGRR